MKITVMAMFGKKSKRGRKKAPLKLKIKPETLYSLLSLFFFAMGGLIIVSFSGQGVFLQMIQSKFRAWFGMGTLFLPFLFFAAGLMLTQVKWAIARPHNLLGGILMFIGFTGLLQAGAIGQNIFMNTALMVREIGAYFLFTLLSLAGYLVMTNTSLFEVVQFFQDLMPDSSKASPLPAEVKKKDRLGEFSEEEKKSGFGFSLFGKKKAEQPSSKEDKKEPEFALDAPKPLLAPLDPDASQEPLSNQPGSEKIWEYPPISLLSAKSNAKADRGDVKKNADIIEDTLDSFGINAEVVDVNNGPAVTQYAIRIATGTKLTRVTALANDLALRLAAPTGQIRIEAPIPGKDLVGIEIPNRASEVVGLRTILSSAEMRKHRSKLAVSLGLDVAGQPVIVDIARMPHCLIAGATGSGKSVCVNAIISSILFRATPQEVKFILVDPKRVELTGYNNIPHLLTPVIVEPDKVVSALKWATVEMDKRYKTLAEVGVKNIEAYNEWSGFTAMPYIVIIIDELADIMLFAPSEVEDSITRIAQMARAVGLHLVLATQRPSVDVITGLIKANVPTRIAFNVASMMDSRVVLDQPGAEKLLGRGDMLYIPPDQSKPSRIQGAFVSDQETKNLLDFIKAQGQETQYQEDITTKYKSAKLGGKNGGGSAGGEAGDRDPLFDDALRLVLQDEKGSASFLQRRLKLGYSRAARILDEMHEAGFIGPSEGSKPRELNAEAIQRYFAQQEQGQG